MVDLALLVLRLTMGSLLTGHGFQKLSRRFGGGGLAGTAAWLDSIGLRPGQRWAPLAAGTEFGGGLLTLLGFLNPLGPLGIVSAMTMATASSEAVSVSMMKWRVIEFFPDLWMVEMRFYTGKGLFL